MISPQLFNARFIAVAITFLTAFILSSCSPVEETFDKTINSSISDITDNPEIVVYPDEPVDPKKTTDSVTPDALVDTVVVIDPVQPVDPATPINPIVVIDPPPVDPVTPINPIVVINPVPPVDPVIPVDPIVVIDPIPPVTPVQPAQAKQAQLSWVAPSEREDASPILLSEIAGYRIYFGTKQGSYNNTIEISDSTAMSYVFTKLTTGTYYIVLTTYDTDGRESQYSTEVMVSV